MFHSRRLSRHVCLLTIVTILGIVSIDGLSAQDGGGPTDPLWSIEFTPPLDPAPCGISGSGGFTSQAFSSDATTGAVDVIWSPLTPAIHVVGTLSVESQFAATISCTDTNYSDVTGDIVTTWDPPTTATRFTGTYSLGDTTGAVVIRGWSSKTPMPAALFGVGAAAVDGLLYAIGGATSGTDESSGQDGFTLNQIYDPATDSWSTDTPMLQPRKAPGVAAHGGKIYAAGGIASGVLLGTVEVYDPLLHTWTSTADLLQARARFALVSAGGFLYAIGGQIAEDGTATTSVERYDPTATTIPNNWVNVAPLPQPRGGFAGGAINGGNRIIAAAGGTNALTGSGGSRTPHLYDVASNTWSEGAPMLFHIGLAGGAVVGNGFYVWGHDGLCVQPGQTFIPALGGQPDGWSLLAGMPTKRSSFGIAAVGDVIYAIGGQPSGNTEIATLESYSATPVSHLRTQPSEPPLQPCGGGGGGGGGAVPTFSGGGQSDEVNEFLAYDGISASRTTVSGGDVTFTIFYGSTIIADSFHATFDGTDVTAELNAVPGGRDTVAIDDLAPGRHVLNLTVRGTTSSGRVATERDRLTFVVP